MISICSCCVPDGECVPDQQESFLKTLPVLMENIFAFTSLVPKLLNFKNCHYPNVLLCLFNSSLQVVGDLDGDLTDLEDPICIWCICCKIKSTFVLMPSS